MTTYNEKHNIAYKAFDMDLKCRDFQYEIGKTFKCNDKIKICDRGFHCCKKMIDCLRYYSFETSRFCEVQYGKNNIDDDDKIVSDELLIIREIYGEELKKMMTGEIKEFYDNGQIMYQFFYKDGKQDCKQKEYFENGQLMNQFFYKNGKKEGKQKGWYDDGRVRYEEHYKDGILDGEKKMFYANGNPVSKCLFINGVPNGDFRIWYENGELMKNKIF